MLQSLAASSFLAGDPIALGPEITSPVVQEYRDKTGTLTQGRMAMRFVWVGGRVLGTGELGTAASPALAELFEEGRKWIARATARPEAHV